MQRLLLSMMVILLVASVLSGRVRVAAATDDDDETFSMGTFRYPLPFDTTEYPHQVARVLGKRQSSGWHALDEAAWYMELGLAHKDAAEEALLTKDETGDETGDDTQKSLVALQRASRLFQGMLNDVRLHAKEATYATETLLLQRLATSFYHLAETHALEGGQKKSEQYNQKAHDIYQRLLDGKKSVLSNEELESVELGWAQCRLRMGVALITSSASTDGDKDSSTVEVDDLKLDALLKANMDLVDQLAGGDIELLKQSLALVVQSSGGAGSLSKQMENSKKAVVYFNDAVRVFRKAIEKEKVETERRELKLTLATGLQNLGAAHLTQGELSLASKVNEEAVLLYQEMIPFLEKGEALADLADAQRGVCEVLYALADIYLQNNSFELSKDRYRRAMDYFEGYNVIPPGQSDEELAAWDGADLSSQIQEYIQLLEEYQESTTTDDVGQYDREGYFDDGEGYIMKDDGYEADIHTTLGTLYMANGDDNVMAAIHLEKAVRMYELSGERSTPNMASAKFNLATIYLQSREYQKSAVSHAEAVDLFRATGANSLGGEDPLMGRLSALLAQAQETAVGDDPPKNPPKDASAFKTDQASGMVIDLQNFLDQNDTLKDEL